MVHMSYVPTPASGPESNRTNHKTTTTVIGRMFRGNAKRSEEGAHVETAHVAISEEAPASLW